MNLVEAMKSGRPFKREKDTFWFDQLCNLYSLTKIDIKADDWVVSEEPREWSVWVHKETGEISMYPEEVAEFKHYPGDNNKFVPILLREVLSFKKDAR